MVAFGMASIIAALLQCLPINYMWDQYYGATHDCHGRPQHYGLCCYPSPADTNTVEPATTPQAEARILHAIFLGIL